MAKHEDREVSAETARKWWMALVENVATLIEDAVVLLDGGTAGRAKSLAILGSEELGKAVWVYSAAEYAWTTGAETVTITADMQHAAKVHLEKLLSSEDFSDGLEHFWSDYSPIDVRGDSSSTIAYTQQLNREKQNGFYVDQVGDEIRSPSAIPDDGIIDYIVRLAQATEMLLIQDHSRQKYNPGEQLESAQHLHFRILFFAHPEMREWFDDDGDRPARTVPVGDQHPEGQTDPGQPEVLDLDTPSQKSAGTRRQRSLPDRSVRNESAESPQEHRHGPTPTHGKTPE